MPSARRLICCTPLLILAFVGLACAKPLLADKTRPQNPNAADARGSQSVYVIETQGEPLIVDWQPEQRGDLEVAMHEGVAVVGFDTKGLKLLKDCHIDGKYGFIGVNTKEQLVRLVSAEEVKANLPADALGIIAKIGGELGQSQVLDIAIVMVGKRKTTWANATRKDLKGSCDGATHFVRGATIGAFAMQSGAKGHASTVVEIFGAGLSGKAGSEKSIQNADGLLDACRKASPDLESPPAQCGALIRIELTKLDAAPSKEAAATEDKASVSSVGGAAACPSGFVFTEGKCARPADAVTHACKPGDVRDCSVQCEKTNADSCNTLGAMFWRGDGVTASHAEAATLFKKSCEAGLPLGCFNAGYVSYNGDGVAKDQTLGVQLFQRACSDGLATGCTEVGRAHFFGGGVQQDQRQAAKSFLQGCRGGDKYGCTNLGVMVMSGIGGVKKDDALAAGLYKMACDGGVAMGCGNYGYMVELGRGVPRDEKRAADIYERACNSDPTECIWVGVVHHTGIGVKKDQKRAAAAFKKTCENAVKRGSFLVGTEPLACSLLNDLFGGKYKIDVQPLREAAQSWSPACQQGVERDCTLLSLSAFALGQQQPAKDGLKSACKMGDKWACELQTHGKFK